MKQTFLTLVILKLLFVLLAMVATVTVKFSPPPISQTYVVKFADGRFSA